MLEQDVNTYSGMFLSFSYEEMGVYGSSFSLILSLLENYVVVCVWKSKEDFRRVLAVLFSIKPLFIMSTVCLSSSKRAIKDHKIL